MIIAEITKTGNENALSMLRKFSRRVQGTGLMRRIRNDRYYARPMSRAVKKKRALKRIERTEIFKQLVKEGKKTEAAPRHGQGKEKAAPSQNNARKE